MWQVKPLQIEQKTAYPFENKICFAVETQVPVTLKLRVPQWAEEVELDGAEFTKSGSFVTVVCNADTTFTITFAGRMEMHTDLLGNDYFTSGALVYSYPIAAKEYFGITYQGKYRDTRYEAIETMYQNLRTVKDSAQTATCKLSGKDVQNPPLYTVKMKNVETEAVENVELQPIGTTILRRTTFPIGDARLD